MKKYIILFLFSIILIGCDNSSLPFSKGKKKDNNLVFFAAAYFLSTNTTSATGYENPSCYPDTSPDGKLIISEIGDCSVNYTTCWFEVFNSSRSPINLSSYKLRTSANGVSSGAMYKASHSFDFPDKVIESGKFHVIRAKNSTNSYDGPDFINVADTTYLPTWWLGRGFIEILDKNNSTVDFVRFGANTENPTSSSFSYSTNAPSLSTTVATNPGMTIARDCKLTNTKSGNDWFSRSFPTPAAANDVTCTIDADEDGIPDCAEVNESQSYAGWNYYKMGARTNQKDILVEVDWTENSNYCRDAEAIVKSIAFMKKYNFNLIVDAGKVVCSGYEELYKGNEINSVGKYDTQYVEWGSANSTQVSVHKLKADSMRLSRLPVFHYAVLHKSLADVGGGGSAEVFGNDIKIGTGTNEYVFVHELGHNLGLHHGGFEAKNFKPNYMSLMNYLYMSSIPLNASETGLPYYRYLKDNNINPGSTSCYSSADSRWSISSVMAFSDGLSPDMNENSLNENSGTGKSGFGSIDFNCNGSIENTTSSLNLTPVQPDNTTESTLDVLKDYNDVANMKLTFRNYSAGFRNASGKDKRQIPVHSYINNDKQEIVDDRGMPTK